MMVMIRAIDRRRAIPISKIGVVFRAQQTSRVEFILDRGKLLEESRSDELQVEFIKCHLKNMQKSLVDRRLIAFKGKRYLIDSVEWDGAFGYTALLRSFP